MKRTKIGDVYAFKTERGYRILQWAYDIEKKGEYVRVFPNFYEEVPQNIEKIISGDCSYIMSFAIRKLYSKGVLELIYRAPEDSIPPFPKHDIEYHGNAKKGYFEVCESDCHQNFECFDGYPDGRGLPRKYRKLRLINGCVDGVWFIYLLTSDFDLQHWDCFYPREKYDYLLKKYGPQLLGKDYDSKALK